MARTDLKSFTVPVNARYSREPQYSRFSARIEFINWNIRGREAVLARLRSTVLKRTNIFERPSYWEVFTQEGINKNKTPKATEGVINLKPKGPTDHLNNISVVVAGRQTNRVFALFDLKTEEFVRHKAISLGGVRKTENRKHMSGNSKEPTIFMTNEYLDNPSMRNNLTEEIKTPIQATEDNVADGSSVLVQHVNDLHLDGYTTEYRRARLDVGLSIATSLSHVTQQTRVGTQQRMREPPHVSQIPDLSTVRHQEFIDVHTREETFRYHEGSSNWPHDDTVQDTKVLAAHGFFYTGRFDLCRCYQCGLGLKDWSVEDDLLFVHLKYSPNCQHITRTVDPNIVNVYRRSVQQSNGRGGLATNAPGAGSPSTTRHPEYEQYQVRLESFTQWPNGLIQTPAMLAEAGFFHTGLRDIVRCHACDGGLQSWDAGDQPWIEHARWFPTCPYVLREKGEEYVRLVQASTEHETDEFQEYSDVPVESVYPIFSDAAKTVIEAGYSRKAVTIAIDVCRAKSLPLSADNMMNVLLDKQDRGEVLPTDEPIPATPEMPQFNETTKQGLLEEREYLRNRLLCYECGDRECNTLFLPCGHHKMCTECSVKFESCPLCGKPIRQRVKTYMS